MLTRHLSGTDFISVHMVVCSSLYQTICVVCSWLVVLSSGCCNGVWGKFIVSRVDSIAWMSLLQGTAVWWERKRDLCCWQLLQTKSIKFTCTEWPLKMIHFGWRVGKLKNIRIFHSSNSNQYSEIHLNKVLKLFSLPFSRSLCTKYYPIKLPYFCFTQINYV